MKLYFHVRAGADFFPDAEGCEVEDLTQAHEQIAEVAQEFEVPADEDWSFEVTNADGRIVLIVPVSSKGETKEN